MTGQALAGRKLSSGHWKESGLYVETIAAQQHSAGRPFVKGGEYICLFDADAFVIFNLKPISTRKREMFTYSEQRRVYITVGS